MVEPVKKYSNCHIMRDTVVLLSVLSVCHPNLDAVKALNTRCNAASPRYMRLFL
jgi:hypothetical protein